jgi:hypothetical protein
MKTYILIICIIAICAIQVTSSAAASYEKCSSKCFEGCEEGVCKKTLQCAGCSRKFYEDKEDNKEKIKLMKQKDNEKIQEIKENYKQDMKELLEKQSKETEALRKKHDSEVEDLKQEYEEKIKKTKVILKNATDKKIKELETVCRGSDCPCCSGKEWKLNCSTNC